MIFIENNLVLKNKCYKNIKDEDSIRNINEISDEMQIITKLTENNDELTIKISEYSEQVKLLTETIARNKLQQQKQLQIIVRNIKYSNNLEKEDMNRVLEKTIEKQQLMVSEYQHMLIATKENNYYNSIYNTSNRIIFSKISYRYKRTW